MARQVTCIKKQDHFDPRRRITAIGGQYLNGARWTMSEDDAIRAIENRTESFFVSVKGQTADVIVAIHEGRKYLKTRPDGEIPDNLLSLPECS